MGFFSFTFTQHLPSWNYYLPIIMSQALWRTLNKKWEGKLLSLHTIMLSFVVCLAVPNLNLIDAITLWIMFLNYENINFIMPNINLKKSNTEHKYTQMGSQLLNGHFLQSSYKISLRQSSFERPIMDCSKNDIL